MSNEIASSPRNGAAQHARSFGLEGLEQRRLLNGAVVTIGPGDNITAAVNSLGAGDTVLLNSGVYQQNVDFEHDGVTLAAAPGASVAIEGYIFGDAHSISVTGVTVQNLRNPAQNENAAIRTNTWWRLTDVTVQNCTGAGVGVFGDGNVLERVKALHNGLTGIGGAEVTNSLIDNCEVAFNNRGVVDPPWAGQQYTYQINGLWYASPVWEGGGGKWHGVDNILIRGMHAHDNGGPGVWLDGSNSNVWIFGGEFNNNVGVDQEWEGMGVQVEISPGPVHVWGNYLHDNQGSGVDLAESPNSEAVYNTFVNNGMELRAIKDREQMFNDVAVHHNRFVNAGVYFTVKEAVGAFSIYQNVYDNQTDLFSGQQLGETTGTIGTELPAW